MTQRTIHALQAAFVFAIAQFLLFISGLDTAKEHARELTGEPVNIEVFTEVFVHVGALTFGIAFLVTFSVWWLVFRTEKVGIWHAIYVGYIIIALFLLGTVALMDLIFDLTSFAKLIKAIPGILLVSLPYSIPAMLLGLGLRWLQRRGAKEQASGT